MGLMRGLADMQDGLCCELHNNVMSCSLQVSVDQTAPATLDGSTLISTGQSAERCSAQALGSSQNIGDQGYATTGSAENR